MVCKCSCSSERSGLTPPAFPSRLHLPPSISQFLRALRRELPEINFITLHYAYFLAVCLVSAVIFWGASTPARSVSFTDSLFLTVSAMTLAGLNTVNLSTINTFQQFLLFLLIMLGSAILVSSVVVHVRKKAFERRFKSIVEQGRKRARAARGHTPGRRSLTWRHSATNAADVDGVVVRGRPILSPEEERVRYAAQHRESATDLQASEAHRDPANEATVPATDPTTVQLPPVESSPALTPHSPRLRFASSTQRTPGPRHRVFSMSGVGAHPTVSIGRGDAPSYAVRSAALTDGADEKGDTAKYFKSGGFIGRNSQFYSLTFAERERLGGVEYRAICLLEVVVPLYFVAWQLLGCLGLGAWIAAYKSDVTLQNGLNPWWVGAFNAVSAFNNSGMSLLDANMVAFQDSFYVLITMGLLILAGNTCYPIFLRLILWSFLKLLPDHPSFAEWRSTLRFLLDHPRRCYTTLFPSRQTWWLLGSIVLLNGVDWAAFEVLNIGNDFLAPLPTGTRVIDGLFQALAVRSGGFYVVNLSQVRIGLLVLYVIMMYISVYPVVITMRNSNVYEERSLGVYADDPAAHPPATPRTFAGLRRTLSGAPPGTITTAAPNAEPRGYFVRQQLRGQLAHDVWWIVLAVLLIVITETGQFEAAPIDYSVFNVIFEVVSAYGCVGISVGLPNVAYSFSGGWHTLSKLILCAVMLRGRHRGLPVAIDRAVLLPGEQLSAAEEEDAMIRLDRKMTGTMREGIV